MRGQLRPTPRARRRASISSASSAHSRWPERMRFAPCSTEASSQACLTISTMSGDSDGARALPVFIRSSDAVEIGRQTRRIDLPMAQDRGDVGVGAVEQADQHMLDLDIVVGPQGRQACRTLQRSPADVVQPSDQRLQLNRGHELLISSQDGLSRRPACATNAREISASFDAFDKRIVARRAVAGEPPS